MCQVVDVWLLDHSGTDRKASSVKLGFFYDHPPSPEIRETLGLLRAAGNEPVSCFAVPKTDDGYELSTSKEFFAVKAVGASANATAPGLHTTHAAPLACARAQTSRIE